MYKLVDLRAHNINKFCTTSHVSASEWLPTCRFLGGRLGGVSQLDDDLEDAQEELLVGGLAGEQRHGRQLQLAPAALQLLGRRHHHRRMLEPATQQATAN